MSKSNVHNIYIDGSHMPDTKNGGIGLYNSKDKTKISRAVSCDSSHAAETLALALAVKHVKDKYLNKNGMKARIFTDCRNVFAAYQENIKKLYNIDLHWIPRELNSEADELAGKYKDQLDTKTISINYDGSNITTNKTIKSKRKISGKDITVHQMVQIMRSYDADIKLKLLEKLKDSLNSNLDSFQNASQSIDAVWEMITENKPNIKIKNKTAYLRLVLAIAPELIPEPARARFKRTKKITKETLNILLSELKPNNV